MPFVNQFRQVHLLLLLSVMGPVHAEDWPGWRGPRGDGSSTSQHVSRRWNGITGDGIAWKTPLPGEGHSSPITWKDQVFLSACDAQSQTRNLVCFDLRSGDLLWQRSVLQARLESKHTLNSYATGTPATDGQRVYVAFLSASDEQVLAPNVGSERLIHPGEIVVAAYNMQGEQQWMVRPGPFLSAHGFASNPVLFEDLVILNGDHDGDSYVVALDKATGETVWKTPRHHRTRSYVTPIIRRIEGAPQLVLSGSQRVAAFSPGSGAPLWHVEGPTEQFVASMVFDGKTFFAVGGYPTHHAIAISPTGRGDVSGSHVLWHKTNLRCYVPSPVIVGNYFLVADDRGTANCFDTQTGERHWQTRMGKHYSASLITARGLVYFVADDGITKLLRPGKSPEVVATNPLGENTYASPAVAHDALLFRGEHHLICVGAEGTP